LIHLFQYIDEFRQGGKLRERAVAPLATRNTYYPIMA